MSWKRFSHTLWLLCLGCVVLIWQCTHKRVHICVCAHACVHMFITAHEGFLFVELNWFLVEYGRFPLLLSHLLHTELRAFAAVTVRWLCGCVTVLSRSWWRDWMSECYSSTSMAWPHCLRWVDMKGETSFGIRRHWWWRGIWSLGL